MALNPSQLPTEMCQGWPRSGAPHLQPRTPALEQNSNTIGRQFAARRGLQDGRAGFSTDVEGRTVQICASPRDGPKNRPNIWHSCSTACHMTLKTIRCIRSSRTPPTWGGSNGPVRHENDPTKWFRDRYTDSTTQIDQFRPCRPRFILRAGAW